MSSSKPTAADPIRFFLGVLVAILDNVHRLNAAEHPVPESPLWLKYSGDEGVGAGTNKPASLNQPSPGIGRQQILTPLPSLHFAFEFA